MKKMKKNYKRWTSTFLAVLLMVSTFLPSGMIQKAHAAIADHVVISQVYGAGGNGGAIFNKDFIELYNPTDQPVSLDGWSLQYASATGTTWQVTNLSGNIAAHGYFLVTQAGGTNGAALPAADVSGVIPMAAAAGKVALLDTTTLVTGAKPTNAVDYVGFGSTASTFEGTGPTPAPSTTLSAQRRPYANVAPGTGKGNAWDTDDNAKDFVSATPVPKNSASPAELPMESNTSLQPIGNQIQFTSNKVIGHAGAVSANSIINVYESVSKGTALATGTAAADGSFEINISSTSALTAIFVSATQGDKDESDAIEISLATASAAVVAEKFSYVVDQSGVGTLIGNAGAAVAQSVINIYPNASAVSSEKLNSQAIEVLGTGGFSAVTFENAPDTIYVTQQSSSNKGIKLESVPVAVAKTLTDTVTPLNVVKETNSSGILTNLNKFFTVEGVVTVDNGIMGSQKNNFFIQDATGGINIFGNVFDSTSLNIKQGDMLKVTGKVIVYNGLTELEATSITRISEGNALPVVKDITILDLNTFSIAEPLEGTLVKVSGKVTATSGSPNVNVTLVDENNKATTVRVMGATGIKVDTDLVIGKSYSITGIVGQFTTNASATNGYQVFPRNAQDITPMLSIEHTALTQVYKDTNLEFVANASGAETVTVYYRETGATDYTALLMTAASEGRYTAILEAANVPQNGFEYYIEAKAGDKSQTSGSSEAPHQVSVIEDLEGPRFFGETPVGGSKVESPRPEITILMEDPSDINVSSIKVWFDGVELDSTKASISKTQVKFTPQADLALGNHTVKVTAADTKGNTTEYEWTFESIARFTGGQHYYGTTHNHTNISHDATGTPEDALKAGQKYNYDWFAFSDHSHDIDPTLLGQDTVERDGKQERTGGADWQLTKDLATQYTKDGEYVVFPAFEMTSTTWGHSNIFGTSNFIDRNINNRMYQDLNNYYAWVMTYDDIVGQFNHPDMSSNAFNNFKPYNQGADKLFTMLEVGNGSGHYAYANAEKKYFSVLDLGWHIAPTYGEDNHDGTWGQTRARTVIVAEDLSQESLLHSMRNMRVYMVEDTNFKLDVLANGYYMGSTVDSKALNFNISGNDPVAEDRSMPDYSYLAADYKSDDRIAKVELISNGGKVVDSITPMTKDFTWNPTYTVTGGQQWFVVKVTQMDGEQMYSSPIWSKEEAVDVKVNGIDVVGEVIVEGNPATLKTNVSNNGTQEVKNLKVDLYYDEVKEANLIGSQNISSILSKGVGTATYTWNSPIKGSHNIIAVITSLDGLDLGDTTYVLPVSVKEPLGIKVLIDAKHNNENTSTDGGTYKDNLKAFTVMLQKEGYTVAENTVALTDTVLSNVHVLVLTHPKTALTAEETAAVAKFVKNGGSLLMAGKSNNSTDPTINNGLLTEIGTAIRMGNDGVFDLSEHGNFWSDPKVSPFAVRAYPGLVSNYITDRVSFLDYYSGTSLSGANNTALTEGGKVVILAKGNETTYQGNIKGGYTYDSVSDETGGSAIPLIASEEIGEKGRIIVSGMNIFNDKQMDEAYEPKGNDEFSLNAINWLAHRETKVTKIGDARKLAEDTHTVIEGTVTTGAGVFFDAFYVQDETGGIMAFQEVPAGSIVPGDKVRIYGHIITFDNNKEIEFTSFEQDVIKIGTGEPVQPKLVPTGEATSDANQGLLVKVKGQVVSKFDENSYVINDGSGDVLVFTDGYIVNQSGPVPVLEVGDTLEAVGLSGEFAQGKRIRVRDTKELIAETKAAVPGKGTLVNGDTPLANITFSMYRTGENQVWYDFTTDENGEFTHELPDGEYQIDGIWVNPTWYPLNTKYTIQNGLVNGTKEFVVNVNDYVIPTPEQGNWNVVGTLVNDTTPLTNVVFSIHTLNGDTWYDAKSDKTGKFAFTLPDGSYQLDGIWDAENGKWYELNQTFTVTNGGLDGTAPLLIDVKPAVTSNNVTGTLSKGTDTFANLVFSVRTTSGEEKWYDVQTDENGQFAFNLPNGSYMIEGIWEDATGTWYVLQKEFTVAGTLVLNIDVLADGSAPVVPNVTGSLMKGTEVLANVVFSIHTTSGEEKWYDAITDTNGNFTFVLPNGTYKLEGIWLPAEAKWYVLEKEFTVDGTYELDIVLTETVDPIENFQLSIMHTNDTHGNVQSIAKRVTAIKQVRESKPNSLLLDAGDVFSGTLYFNEFKGQADLEFMNLVGYDAMTFGNHEFDLGASAEGHQALSDFVKNAQFPFVSANVNFSKDALFTGLYNGGTIAEEIQSGQIFDGIIKDVNGEKIGIFGLTTEETVEISSPGQVEFSDYIAEAQRMVQAFEAKGVNKIIALTHLGYDDNVQFDNDLELAKQVEGIDVIVGGHTHTKLTAPVVVQDGKVEPTVIVQAGQYSEALGTLDVTFDANGKVIDQLGNLIATAGLTEDTEAVALLAPYKDHITAIQTQSIGVSADVVLDGERANARTKETNLGNLITDGMLAKAKSINPNTLIAVTNGGGIRTSIATGDITLGEVLTVMPFGNTLGIMNLTGAEIKAALEHSVSQAPNQNGGFLHVSGMKFTYDSSKEAGQRVVSVEVKGQDGSYTALVAEQNYFVATNTFTAKGGDGYSMFETAYKEGRVSEPGFVDYEMFIDYLKTLPTVAPTVEGRIVDVNVN
jgi:2',3'-cyclic-nucleotide 2'-phosphodiesterase (5'-nucleotidase family)/DNA/RNA endonuclease YhcR with UshA esterase domain